MITDNHPNRKDLFWICASFPSLSALTFFQLCFCLAIKFRPYAQWIILNQKGAKIWVISELTYLRQCHDNIMTILCLFQSMSFTTIFNRFGTSLKMQNLVVPNPEPWYYFEFQTKRTLGSCSKTRNWISETPENQNWTLKLTAETGFDWPVLKHEPGVCLVWNSK